MTQPKVLIFSEYYLPGYKGGGPIKTIKNLVENLDEFFVRIITNDRDLGSEQPFKSIIPGKWNNLSNSQIFYAQPGLKGFIQIIKIVLDRNKYNIIYVNSFFSIKFSLLPTVLGKLLNRQVILGPRGEFSEGALKLKNTKKNIFIKAYKLLGLPRGIVFQASSTYEAQDIRNALGLKAAIVIAEDVGSQDFAKNISIRNDQITKAVFISRISPKKNLSFALESLKRVKSELIYDIYGPIEDLSYWQECQMIIRELPSNITVQYMGELTPNKVVKALSSYDFFFMPTKGENYGHVIAEALCAGLPLVIADTTPWRNLESLGIGWDLPLDNIDAFSEVIDNLIEMSDDHHYKLRQTVLAWAKQKFAQRDAIEANIAMFRYAYNKKKGINNVI
ncbi:glycosyltransferase [Psychrobacter sp.]|uniref:glycosyltransferase family 4 protein n=1 Tax=Psychrobacter sp. TaxID=56811 RepID=UPI0025CD8A9B|nr:glycosyltransferase [Psychrobacter sp.]